MFNQVLIILFWVIFIYCSFSVLYLFVFAVAAKFSKANKSIATFLPLKRIAVLIPAYKEDEIILATAQNMLSQDYPSNLFDVYIIADSFKNKTIEQLEKLPLHVLKVSFSNSSKTKSLNECFKNISHNYDIALICDADNMLAKGFLKKVNDAFLSGAKAVQGRRVAKNMDTSFAILDSCSEAINNNIFRKGTNALGLSSSLIGSGMAFEFDTLKAALSQISVISGFDKVLQLKITELGDKIIYLEDALIFDEKVDNSNAFKEQRKRWLLSQFIYLKKYFFKGCTQLLRGNASYFNLAVASNLVSPRAFLIAGLPAVCVAACFIQPPFGLSASLILMLLYVTSMVIAIPSELKTKELLNALLQLPKAIILMMGSLFKMKKAKNVFIHTVHTKNEITNPLYTMHGE
jgi:cellulose synthase/poly-beta-1,6-N-acetylglucosamine synthase-like glycosyltransferase